MNSLAQFQIGHLLSVVHQVASQYDFECIEDTDTVKHVVAHWVRQENDFRYDIEVYAEPITNKTVVTYTKTIGMTHDITLKLPVSNIPQLECGVAILIDSLDFDFS